MCRWSGTCWVDAVREDCQYVYYSDLIGQMTSLMTDILLEYVSLLSTTLHTTNKWFLTVKMKFHPHNPSFNFPSTYIVAPTVLPPWLACWLRAAKTGTAIVGELRNRHPFLDFDSEKKSICMHPMWIQKTTFHPPLPCSWAMTCHTFIIDHCFLLLLRYLGYL